MQQRKKLQRYTKTLVVAIVAHVAMDLAAAAMVVIQTKVAADAVVNNIKPPYSCD